MTKTRKPGRPKTSAAERHEWAMICNRIHEAAGLTQEQVAEALGVSVRQWGYYLAGKRCPKTLEEGANIIEAAASRDRGWFCRTAQVPQRRTDGTYEEMLWTPADRLSFKELDEEDAVASAHAQAALKALERLNLHHFTRTGVSDDLFAGICQQVEVLRAKLNELPPAVRQGRTVGS